MKLVPRQLISFFKLEREDRDVHDFLGIRYFDPARNVMVLPEHVAALLRVSGTDFAYRPEERVGIIDGWANLLNGSGLDVQLFYHRRPINWSAPGGHLDGIKAQVDAATMDPDSWEQRRFKRYLEALTSGREEALLSVNEIYQYVVIRFPLGVTEAVAGQENERAMYLPPKTGWRFWEQVSTLFGGPEGRAAWEQRATRASHKLNEEVNVFMGRASAINNFDVERATPLETIQILHLLWMEEEAYAPGLWITDTKMMNEIIDPTAEVSTSATGISVRQDLIEPEDI